MDKFIFEKIVINPILFYKSLVGYGYIFDKNLEKYFVNKSTKIDKNTKENMNRIYDIFSINKNINIEPFIILLLSVDKSNLKNIYRHFLIKWNNYKKKIYKFKNKTFKFKLNEIKNLDMFLESVNNFINSEQNKEYKNKCVYFILNCIQNYYYLF